MPLTKVDLEYLSTIRDSNESILRAAIGDSLDVAILDASNQKDGFNRTCGTSFIIPFGAHEVPVSLGATEEHS